MTTLAGRKIRRYREAQTPKLSRQMFGDRFDTPFSTVQGWEEGGKVPRDPGMMRRICASGIVEHADWFTPAECPRCERPADSQEACGAQDCPLAVHNSKAA